MNAWPPFAMTLSLLFERTQLIRFSVSALFFLHTAVIQQTTHQILRYIQPMPTIYLPSYEPDSTRCLEVREIVPSLHLRDGDGAAAGLDSNLGARTIHGYMLKGVDDLAGAGRGVESECGL